MLLFSFEVIVFGARPIWPLSEKRQAVDEYHHVRPPIILPFDDSKLVHRQPIIVFSVMVIHQPRIDARDAAICAPLFHRHPIGQHGMKVPVSLCRRQRANAHHQALRILAHINGYGPIQKPDRIALTPNQHHIAECTVLPQVRRAP